MGILGFQALRLALFWSWEGKPQRLKPQSIRAVFGTSEEDAEKVVACPFPLQGR